MNQSTLYPIFRNLLTDAKRAVSRQSPPNVLITLPSTGCLQFLANVSSDGLVVPILVGPKSELEPAWDYLSRSRVYILDADSREAAVEATKQYIHDERADILFWCGMTSLELQETIGHQGSNHLSHAAAVALPNRDRLLVISDGGWNLEPDLQETIDIIHNCITLMTALQIDYPKIAILSAVVDVDAKIPRTMDAAALSQLSRRGVFHPTVVDGPMRFDHAVTLSTGHEPPLNSPVAGDADAVIAGSIEEANILLKALVHLGEGQFGSLLLGGNIPVAWPAWNGPGESPLLSLLLAVLVWNKTTGSK